MDILTFLEKVYEGSEGWIDLPGKVNNNWSTWDQRWPDRRKAEKRFEEPIPGENLYFSVTTFSEKGRNIDHVQPAHWLWADLDLVPPAVCIKSGLTPTICWETSKGRYQALWELTEVVDPQELSRINRMLTYALDADHGGWDLTQVLRIPGTRNYKYPDTPKIEILFDDGPIYTPKAISKRLRKLVPLATEREQIRQYEPKLRWTMPPRIRRLLRTPPEMVVEGERSEVLWKIECELVEAGVPEEVIFRLVWPCAWNKHAEVHSGQTQLRREIARAVRHVAGSSKKASVPAEDEDEGDELIDTRPLGRVSYASFMAQNFTPPQWLVEGIWTAKSHGIIGGEPKTCKSTLALALGLSVASGHSFLGHFPVRTTGPVLIVQEENSAELVQDRLTRIAESYGLLPEDHVSRNGSGRRVELPADVPLELINYPALDLMSPVDCKSLELEIREVEPIMVILDPLYLMLGRADENSSSDLRPVLQWFLRLRYKYGVAICIVHHFRKAGKEETARLGQRMLGSTTLHGWVESSLYVELLDPTAMTLRVHPETRNMPPQRPLDITLRMGQPGDFEFSADVAGVSLEEELRQAIGSGTTVIQVAKALGVSKWIARKRIDAAGYETFKKGSGPKSSIWVIPKDEGGDGQVIDAT